MTFTRLFPILLLITSPAFGDTLTGRLVDQFGNPIVNGDVDAFDIVLDDDITLTGDSTDAAGNFSVTIPSGLYDITLQGPPGSTFISSVVPNLLIVGTTDIGTITLEPGFNLSGRVLDVNGFPIANLDLDFTNLNTGQDLDVSGDRSDTFGLFSILVPANIELQFDTRTVLGATLAPRAIELNLTANTNLGDITIQPGFIVTGQVLTSLGTPIVGADLDFKDFVTGEQTLTLSDNSDATGNFSVVVPAGTWNIEICAAEGQLYVAREFIGVPISTNVFVGSHTMLDAVVLTGTVFGSGGAPAANVDVDVNDSFTGDRVFLCGDNTDVNGNYSVLVPQGSFDIRLTTPTELGLHAGVNIQGPLNQITVLTPCPPASVGFRNGSGTNPLTLWFIDPPRIGKDLQLVLDCTAHAPSVAAVLLNTAPIGGVNTIYGELLVGGASIFTLGTGHASDVQIINAPVPPNLSLCGRRGYMQALVFGAPGPQFSNAIDLTVGS